MEKAQRLIRTWVASPRDKEIEDTVDGLAKGDIKLLHVVQGLGDYLTSEDDDLRNKGVEFLAKVVGKTSAEHLNRQSVKVLLAFFLTKMEDLDTIIPALKGLMALTRLPNLLDEDAITVIKAIFSHVKMPALVQAQRFTVFSIVDNLIATHREALKSMRDEFLTGYLILADGEKDPRNLMLAFAVARVILIEFDVTNRIEEMFNITACYFPISFRPPPDDPYGISADDLKAALRGSLSANAAFAPFMIPLILEKLASAAPPTKRDVLLALDDCLPVYGAGHARTYARKLWNALKLEIFQPTDPHTEREALKSVQVLIKTIYSGGASSDDIEGLAKEACEECVVILKEPEKSQATPAMKTLCAFVSTTPSVCQYTVAQVVPHHVKMFLNPDEAPNRGPTLKLLASFIVALRDSVLKSDEDQASLLTPYKDEVLGIFITGVKTPSSSSSAIEGLRALVTTPKLLDDDEVGFIVNNVNDVITSGKEDVAGVNDDALDLLKTISTIAPGHVSQNTLPLLFSLLPDEAPTREDVAGREKYWNVLSSLSRLCEQAVLFETLVVRLSTKLDLLCSPNPSASRRDPEPTAAYAHSILNTLSGVLEKKVERGDADVPKYIDRLVLPLLNLFIGGAVSKDDPSNLPVTDFRLILLVSNIVNLVMQTLSAEKQEAFVRKLFTLYLEGDLKAIALSARSALPDGATFTPFLESAPPHQANIVTAFSHALVALRKEVRLPVEDPSAFLSELVRWSIETAKTTPQRESAWHIVAALVNKRVADCESFLKNMLESFSAAALKDTAKPTPTRQVAIFAWAWVSKGLLVQNHALATDFVEHLFELFGDEAISWDAARSVGNVVAPSKILVKSNHAVIRVLHAQKYASRILPRLISGAKDTSDTQKQTANLVALLSLIRSIPKAAYAREMPTLLPLLLRGLELSDTELRANVIDTLLSAAQADVEADVKHAKEGNLVAEHASSLTSIMLKNANIATMPDARVRIAALRYLTILPKVVRYDILHPHKSTVVRELVKVLDDPKRSVRKEAVDARTSWYVYSG
ncbi:ARM repeat-containing protein [Peniophora sp. CONT]|nr:ARM repeat-containing protein [Peniophora sp. CONT]